MTQFEQLTILLQGRERGIRSGCLYAPFLSMAPVGWSSRGVIKNEHVRRPQVRLPGGREGTVVLAAKAAWMIENGHVPDGLQIIHLCHNRKCVNPGHLAIGTLEANIYSG